MKYNCLLIFTSRTSESMGLKREGGLFLLTKIFVSIILLTIKSCHMEKLRQITLEVMQLMIKSTSELPPHESTRQDQSCHSHD